MKARKILLFCISFLWGAYAFAQQYRFEEYRVAEGLPSDVVKQITQDQLGFLWIATDDGLVRYDGQRFISYKNALRNQYAKGFLHTRDGRLLAFADLDIIEIDNQVDTVIFKSLIRGTRNPTDSTVWYPKSLFEDHQGNIWIGEAQSVSVFDGKKIKRYEFGIEDRSNSFLRSFNFFEDDNKVLYCFSYNGNLYRFDVNAQKFIAIQAPLIGNINNVYYKEKVLWLATKKGVFKMKLESNGILNAQQILAHQDVSCISFVDSKTLLAGSFTKETLLIVLQVEEIINSQPLRYNFHNVKNIYTSQQGDSWAATNKGVVYIRRNVFITPSKGEENTFIESITQNSEDYSIYFCTKNRIYKIDSANLQTANLIYDNSQSYFQSLCFSNGFLWAANMYGVVCFKEGKPIKEWDFSAEGKFVHDLFVDKKGNVWASQASNPFVILIDSNAIVQRVKVPIAQESNVNLIREGNSGLYAASNGVSNYLFFKEKNQTDFKNISLPITFSIGTDFNIHDLEPNDTVIWLASTEGLLKYNYKSVSRVSLGAEMSNFSVKSVQMLDKEHLLFANSMGLFCYNLLSEEFWLYDENAGLPSNTITEESIFTDHLQRPWIGTSDGVAFAPNPLISGVKTPSPICLEFQVNGSKVKISEVIELPNGAFINALFSSISFPEKQVIIQWRIDNGDPPSNWQTLKDNTLKLSDLPNGLTIIELRAKNAGMHWSGIKVVKLNSQVSFWASPIFAIIIVFAVAAVAWLSYIITNNIIGRRKNELEKLVDERTRALKIANEELIHRNTELDRFVYSASHDLSAPLKSILGLISVARLDKPNENQNHYLNLMEGSVAKLEVFIKDVVNYSRNSRQKVKYQPINFNETVESVLQNINYLPGFDLIKFEVLDQTEQAMFTDLVRLKIILNNLLSNAIKFHSFTTGRTLFVRIILEKERGNYNVIVQDNGKGIEQQALGKIFEMFYRADENSTGSGLGLYILKETVTKLEGTINVKSKIGEGTTFIITLPANRNSDLDN